MEFDIRTVPFSYSGSYLAFSYPWDGKRHFSNQIAMRVLYGTFSDQECYPIYFADESGNPIEGTVKASPEELSVCTEEKELRICFQNKDTVHVKANGRLCITKTKLFEYDRIMQHEFGAYEIAGRDASIVFEILKGSAKDCSEWSREGVGCESICMEMEPGEIGETEFKMTLCGMSYEKPEEFSYEQNLSNVKANYCEFCRNFQTEKAEFKSAMELAAYISWHSIVKPEGYIKYPVMLMTKNRMNLIWSWDYAFNALAMIDKNAELAYQQFLAVSKRQDKQGAFPDAYHSRADIRTFVKPPVQGYFLKRMFQIQKPDREVTEELYNSTARFTDWWMKYRARVNGIPVYHHGNDSGWDNSTVFLYGAPVKSPDLCTWLIIQMDFLAETAKELGREKEAESWKLRSEELLQKMLSYFVENKRMRAVKIPENKTVECDSLILYIPLLLGDKLPQDVRETMLGDLLEKKRFLCEYGFASEPLDSPYFVEDGYWRGAVWPATALLMTEVLTVNGKKEEAREYAEKFCNLCKREGFFENYSALDGHGLRDPGYTWTASVFMILVRGLD